MVKKQQHTQKISLLSRSRQKSWSFLYNRNMTKEQILDAILKAKNLQEYVDITAKQINCPYWVMNEGFELVAISHIPNALHIYNDFVKNTSLMESLKRWETYDIFSQEPHRDPMRFKDDYLDKEIMILDAVYHEIPMGRITLFPNRLTKKEDVMLMVEGICVYLRNQVSDQNRDTYHQAFASLLRGEEVEICANVLQEKPLALKPPYQIACIASGNRDKLFGYVTYLQERDEKIIPVVTGGYLYALISKDHSISKWESQFNHIGISYAFDDLQKTMSYGIQAKYIQENISDKFNLIKYTRYLLEQNIDLESLICPKVKECMKYDHKYQTQYFDTLYTYLMNAESKQATARQLDVHINTIKYRLGQIESLFNIDFERDRMELLLSCLIEKS